MTSMEDSNIKTESKDSTENELITKARKELGQDAETKEECLELLKEMISGQTNLHSRTDDGFLLRFLRARKFDVKRAFVLLKNYYAYRIKHPDLFENLTVDTVKPLVVRNMITLLPKRDSKGRAMSVIRIGPAHPDEFPFPLGLQATIIGLEKAIESEETQINGLTILVDLEGFGVDHIAKLATPSALYKTVSFTQDCFPVRLKEIHILFNPSIFSTAFSLISPLLKRKMRKRINFHGYDLDSLHSHIHPDLLPEEYGGTQGPIDNTIWKASLNEWQNTLQWHLKEFGYVSE